MGQQRNNKMKKMITFRAVLPLAAVAMFASASVSNAELVKTGDFIYDTVQDLTFYDVNPGNMNWSDAKAWALRLVAGGGDDWRLPADSVQGEWSSGNGNELATVTSVGSFDGNVPFTHTQFITLDGFPFWSSVYGRGNNHLQIGNDDGFVNDDKPDTDLRGVIAVRSGAIPVATSNAILAATSAMAAPKLPKGFIVYSRGRGGNRTLHMVIACHQAVASAETEQELLESICEIPVDHRQYRCARRQRILPGAQARIPGAVGQADARAGGQAYRRRPLQGAQPDALRLRASAEPVSDHDHRKAVSG